MLSRLYQHHVLANLTFVLVLVMGLASYLQMPREKDPTINFNWIQITTALPGATAEDIEKRVTEPLEEAIAKISDIRFISSSSRESLSSILVRFEDIETRLFDKRLNDLRREIQNAENTKLPEEAESPFIYEVTSANAFPTATLVLQGQASDETLRRYGYEMEKELERMGDVDRVDLIGVSDPELIIDLYPERLTALGVKPSDVADSVTQHFRDVAAGRLTLTDQQWLVRVLGTDADPDYLARLPIMGLPSQVLIGEVADVYWGQERLTQAARFNGKPAILLSVFKKQAVNTLDLVAKLTDFVAQKQALSDATGVNVILADDQTESTRRALGIMQTNALIGLMLVLLSTWLFLGKNIAFFTSIGIPFTLAGTFWLLHTLGFSLNNSVLLAVVIALGMLVDDAVVVVESMYNRLRHGVAPITAALGALKEVFAPVTSAILTTVAAFLPLTLLPGILGQFMAVIPLVVITALLLSLLEAYWMLPTHIIHSRANYKKKSREQQIREKFTHGVQIFYIRVLLKVIRRPLLTLLVLMLLFLGSVGLVYFNAIKINFFAGETFRLYYVNVEMPPGSSLSQTLDKVQSVEQRVKQTLKPDEPRSVTSYAGMMFTEIEPLFGEQYGQIMISLNPDEEGMRSIRTIMDETRAIFPDVTGVKNLSLLELKDGPPTTKPISVKVKGSDFNEIQAAVQELKAILSEMPDVTDISVLDSAGAPQLTLKLNQDAVHRSGLSAAEVMRNLRLLLDGEEAAFMQHQGEEVSVRVRANPQSFANINQLLQQGISLPVVDGLAMKDEQKAELIPLEELVKVEIGRGRDTIRHHNLSRAITVEADVTEDGRNTVAINKAIEQSWLGEQGANPQEDNSPQSRHPHITLDFSGELDDINESLEVLPYLGLFGVGLIYLILGTQFRSYFQPLMIITSIPLAVTGVIFGLFITNNPMSMYTLYGVVALAGIAVNAAIVLISAANDRLRQGMSLNHAIIYAARRRVIPILITSLTTIAGLFSLATGLAGSSLIWGPVATAIVWGLAFSSVLTLFVIPLLYRLFMKNSHLNQVEH